MATLTMEEGLIYKLANTAGVSALVGSRVYGPRFPQGATVPLITTARISTPRVHTHDSSGSAGTAYPRFQIDAWAATEASAKAITDAVRAALNGFRGTITSGANSISVQGALVEDEAPEFDAEVSLYRSRSDYILWHVEA